jgi:hypothetical protein
MAQPQHLISGDLHIDVAKALPGVATRPFVPAIPEADPVSVLP